MDDKERSIGLGSRALDRTVGPATGSHTRTFASASDAAKDAIRQFNPQSIKEGREYGGTIYRLPQSGRFAYVVPPNTQGTGFSGGHVSTAQPIPADAKEAGRWHTHGRTENFTDEDFSSGDVRLASQRRLTSWLGTPKNAIKEAIPTEAGAVILDVEPSEGTRPNIRFVPLSP
jgi:uncharacterized protein DUF4329